MAERTAVEFVNQAAMEDPRFPPVKLDRAIEAAFDFAERIWRNPSHGTFVDHGVDHSYNDLRKARFLLEAVLKPISSEHRLSSYERCVLAIASLFHDIGMQWNNFAPADAKLPLDEVRLRHIEKGQQMLEWAMRGGNDSIPSLAREVEIHDVFGHAGSVGFAHSGSLGWDALMAEKVAHDDWGPEGYPLRLKLLAAAFRLADEVDNSYNRIVEYNRLCGATLDDETLAHWCACHFIHDVRVLTEGWTVCIEVTPRHPLGDPSSYGAITQLLEEFRLRRMREEESRVRPFLGVAGRQVKAIEIRLGEPVRVQIATFPQRVGAYLQSRLETREARHRKDMAPTPAVELISRSAVLVGVRTDIEAADAAGRIAKGGHYALRSGYHCDRYYFLDHLIGSSELDERIIVGLREEYCDRGFNVVLGVGTTGAMIAARLAIALGARFEYTAASAGYAGDGARSAPTAYEKQMRVSSGDRVLVIEDLMGYGTSLAEAVYALRQSSTPPALIEAFCLVVTTDAPARDEILRDVAIRALFAARGVRYWPSDNNGACTVCRDGRIPAVRDE